MQLARLTAGGANSIQFGDPMLKFKSIILALGCALLASQALAQSSAAQQPSPEQMKQIRQATMGAMVSVMGPMTEAVIEAQLTVAVKPETAERIAVFKRRLYEALLKQGFNGIEAMQIVVATSPPSASPSAK